MQIPFQRGRVWLNILLFIVGVPIVAAICGALSLSLALLLANDRLPSMDGFKSVSLEKSVGALRALLMCRL
jgi:hypothetical protein